MKTLSEIVKFLGIKDETTVQGIKYLFVGGSCTLLDFLVLFVGAEVLDYEYLPVSMFSFLCGVVLNYYLSTYWVFKVRVIKKGLLEFCLYVLISLVGLAINTGVIFVATDVLGLYVMFSKLFSAIITYFWNFFARKFLLHYKWNLT